MRLEHVFVSTGISIRETRIRNRARYLPCINLHTDLDRWTGFHAIYTLYIICVRWERKNARFFEKLVPLFARLKYYAYLCHRQKEIRNMKTNKTKWIVIFAVLIGIVIFETFCPLGDFMHDMFGYFGDFIGWGLFGLLIYSGVRLFESDKEIEDTEI